MVCCSSSCAGVECTATAVAMPQGLCPTSLPVCFLCCPCTADPAADAAAAEAGVLCESKLQTLLAELWTMRR